MARLSLVVDASIVVKWYSAVGDGGVSQAVDILDRVGQHDVEVVIPDLLYYEVANALAHKKILSQEKVQLAVSNLFALGLRTISINSPLLTMSVELARKFAIAVYDSCYLAIAQSYNYPLVTANPRHQKQDLGCRVIPIEQWAVNA